MPTGHRHVTKLTHADRAHRRALLRDLVAEGMRIKEAADRMDVSLSLAAHAIEEAGGVRRIRRSRP